MNGSVMYPGKWTSLLCSILFWTSPMLSIDGETFRPWNSTAFLARHLPVWKCERSDIFQTNCCISCGQSWSVESFLWKEGKWKNCQTSRVINYSDRPRDGEGWPAFMERRRQQIIRLFSFWNTWRICQQSNCKTPVYPALVSDIGCKIGFL